jgi:hypothetical protein
MMKFCASNAEILICQGVKTGRPEGRSAAGRARSGEIWCGADGSRKIVR